MRGKSTRKRRNELAWRIGGCIGWHFVPALPWNFPWVSKRRVPPFCSALFAIYRLFCFALLCRSPFSHAFVFSCQFVCQFPIFPVPLARPLFLPSPSTIPSIFSFKKSVRLMNDNFCISELFDMLSLTGACKRINRCALIGD